MNGFNRFLAALLCLALMAGSIALISLAWTIPQESIDGLRDAVDWLEEHNQDLEKAVLTTGGALLALLAFVLLVFELTPKTGTEVKVTDLKVGDAVLSTAAIAQRVEEAVSQVPHVAEARAIVKAKRKGVLVSLDLHVDPEANLADVTDQALTAARDVLTDRVHVALAAPPSARLHYRELRMRGRQPIRQPVREALQPPQTPAPAEAVAANASPDIVLPSPQADPEPEPAGPEIVVAPPGPSKPDEGESPV